MAEWMEKGKYIKSVLRKVTYNKIVIFLVPLKCSLCVSSKAYFSCEKETHMHTPKMSETEDVKTN